MRSRAQTQRLMNVAMKYFPGTTEAPLKKCIIPLHSFNWARRQAERKGHDGRFVAAIGHSAISWFSHISSCKSPRRKSRMCNCVKSVKSTTY